MLTSMSSRSNSDASYWPAYNSTGVAGVTDDNLSGESFESLYTQYWFGSRSERSVTPLPNEWKKVHASISWPCLPQKQQFLCVWLCSLDRTCAWTSSLKKTFCWSAITASATTWFRGARPPDTTWDNSDENRPPSWCVLFFVFIGTEEFFFSPRDRTRRPAMPFLYLGAASSTWLSGRTTGLSSASTTAWGPEVDWLLTLL